MNEYQLSEETIKEVIQLLLTAALPRLIEEKKPTHCE
jgi:hypothetical protein